MNCQQYVETVLARAVSDSAAVVEKNTLSIQYRQLPADYFSRNHFSAADWIPNNIKKNYIYYSPLNTHVISKYEDKRAWCVTQQVDPAVCHEKFVNTVAHLRYVPIKQLPAVASKIPSGSILFIVKPTRYTLISHMGFAIQENGQLYLRSSSSLAGKVVDYPLLDYLRAEPRVLGVSVLIPENRNQPKPS